MGRPKLDRDNDIRAALQRLVDGTYTRSTTGSLTVRSLAIEADVPRTAIIRSPVRSELEALAAAKAEGGGAPNLIDKLNAQLAAANAARNDTRRRLVEVEAENASLRDAIYLLQMELDHQRSANPANVVPLRHP
ncbi:MAG: hypothetical protein JJU45_19100 [Acidimicrobiia bacterium]|nr:hypothetical protein [Acidimicrobiia bacterium]